MTEKRVDLAGIWSKAVLTASALGLMLAGVGTPAAAQERKVATTQQGTQDVPAGSYVNPLPVRVADPFVLKVGETYYLYGTSAGDGFKVWSSRDLVNWEARGYAFRRTEKSWGQKKFWAPEAVERGGKFYLYYSAEGMIEDKQTLRLCVAVSDSPVGPFVDVAAPMVDFGKAMIDGHVFRDEDGRAYLYYSLDCSENRSAAGKPISEIYVLPLNEDLTSVKTGAEPVKCTGPDQPWEGDCWNEAPEVFKRGGVYFMMYSGNGFFHANYGVGYATAASPLGPWVKHQGPVLSKREGVSGPGHNCIVEGPDGGMYVLYHVHRTSKGGGDRVLALDRMEVKVTGTRGELLVSGPTNTAQPIPGVSLVSRQPATQPSDRIAAGVP